MVAQTRDRVIAEELRCSAAPSSVFAEREAMLKAFVLCTLAVASLLDAPVSAATDRLARTDSAAAALLYVQAVRTMQSLPQPTFATFTSNFVGEKTGFDVDRTDDGKVAFSISTGGSSPGPIPTAYRGADRLAALTLKDGRGETNSPLTDPTWAGAAAFARYGLHPPETEIATPVPVASNDLPVIGGVSTFAVAFYHVWDAGVALCPNAEPGEALHLIAFRDPNTHPLTDVIVESPTQRICSMKFKLHIRGPISYAPIVELHFAPVQEFYVSTEGFIDGEVHVLGVGMKHTHVRIERSDMTFPATLPGTAFSDS